MHVHLFIPCLVDQFYPETAQNTLALLKKIGMRVSSPDGQTCCGQPFFKAGYWKKTRPLARRNIRLFKEAEYVVAPSGSCVNMMKKHYVALFQDDPVWAERATDFASKVFELSEFLINIAETDDLRASFRGTVTYHDSCQVVRGLGVSSEPRQLLMRVKNLEFVEMEKSDVCCGFGGVFSFKYPDLAEALVRDKADQILASGAGFVTGCEISCLMHIGGHMAHRRLGVRALHLADILAQDS
jgi:L-lactate dehydrogenase complex protein LldE